MEDWGLPPKAYPDRFYLGADAKSEGDLTRLERWRKQAISNFPSGYIEQVARAQHYGLATRLMDWTAHAAIALYFASAYQFVEDANAGKIVQACQRVNLGTAPHETSLLLVPSKLIECALARFDTALYRQSFASLQPS